MANLDKNIDTLSIGTLDLIISSLAKFYPIIAERFNIEINHRSADDPINCRGRYNDETMCRLIFQKLVAKNIKIRSLLSCIKILGYSTLYDLVMKEVETIIPEPIETDKPEIESLEKIPIKKPDISLPIDYYYLSQNINELTKRLEDKMSIIDEKDKQIKIDDEVIIKFNDEKAVDTKTIKSLTLKLNDAHITSVDRLDHIRELNGKLDVKNDEITRLTSTNKLLEAIVNEQKINIDLVKSDYERKLLYITPKSNVDKPVISKIDSPCPSYVTVDEVSIAKIPTKGEDVPDCMIMHMKIRDISKVSYLYITNALINTNFWSNKRELIDMIHDNYSNDRSLYKVSDVYMRLNDIDMKLTATTFIESIKFYMTSDQIIDFYKSMGIKA